MLEQKLAGHRITIILEEDIVKNLRKKQAKMLMGTSRSVTLTSVIKEILRDSFINEKN